MLNIIQAVAVENALAHTPMGQRFFNARAKSRDSIDWKANSEVQEHHKLLGQLFGPQLQC